MVGRWTFVAVTLASCAEPTPPPPAPPPVAHPEGPWPPAPMGVRTAPQAGATSPAPGSPPPGPPGAPVPVYTADETVRDALASPLSLVGIGGWTGYYRHLSCIYRNAQVIVVDMRCNERETYQFDAVVDSPARGRVELVADARQKTVALSTVQRPDYETFSISGAGPWAGPPALSVGMSYDQITAFDELRSRFQGGCQISPGVPQGVCSHGAPFAAGAFASANASFFRAPPHDWYRFVQTLAGARAASYAATDLAKVSAGQLAAWAGAVGFQNDIDVSDKVLPFVGQPGHFAAAVLTADGGMAYAGTRRGAQIVVARTDRTGHKLWEAVLPEPGIRQEESASLVATDSGYYVHAEGFVDTAVQSHHRLYKLDAHGKVLWKWYPSKRPPPAQVPQFFRAELTPQATVLIDGYLQLEKDGAVHAWTAEVSTDGKSLRDEVGSVEQGQRNSKP
ncbi:MAG: hypothetical protein ACRENE_17790 [Polyangiaceae bacterium]